MDPDSQICDESILSQVQKLSHLFSSESSPTASPGSIRSPSQKSMNQRHRRILTKRCSLLAKSEPPTEQLLLDSPSTNMENEPSNHALHEIPNQGTHRLINQPKNFTVEGFAPDIQRKLIRDYYIPLCGIPVFRVPGVPQFLRQIPPSTQRGIDESYRRAVTIWYEKNQFLLEIDLNEAQDLLESLPGIAKNNLRNLTIIFLISDHTILQTDLEPIARIENKLINDTFERGILQVRALRSLKLDFSRSWFHSSTDTTKNRSFFLSLGTSFKKLQLRKLVVVVKDDLEVLNGIFRRFSNVSKSQFKICGDCQALVLEAATESCLVWGLGAQRSLPKYFLPIKKFDERCSMSLHLSLEKEQAEYDVEDFWDASGESTVGFQPAYPDLFEI